LKRNSEPGGSPPLGATLHYGSIGNPNSFRKALCFSVAASIFCFSDTSSALTAPRSISSSANEYFDHAWNEFVLPRFRYAMEVGAVNWEKTPKVPPIASTLKVSFTRP